MKKFESVETKSSEFRVAYSELMHRLHECMLMDSAFADKVRQAASQFDQVYFAYKPALFVSFLPRHAYQLGRYNNPELHLYKYRFSGLSDLREVKSLILQLRESAISTLTSLVHMTRGEDPARWFSGFSKCSYWESLSTAMTGVLEYFGPSYYHVYKPILCEEAGEAVTVGISSDVRGFLYPVLAVRRIGVQCEALAAILNCDQRFRDHRDADRLRTNLHMITNALFHAEDCVTNLVTHLMED